ncbi:BOS complex subunit ncln-like isoform X2 [Halichondria panicea]|uniref:BOS complex subunit ncln-like isoform X2 n=1 Tax=Halichondria panicea TaxID=6063 RepID=UPI00312BA75B
MVVDVEGAWDLLKGVPVTLWMLSSVMLLSALSPACAVHEFTAHRMQQFDLYGNQYGSRSSLVNMEARGEVASMLNRKCVVVRWAELSYESFMELVERGAGSIIILLPLDIVSVDKKKINEWRQLEAELLLTKVPIPVYFVPEDTGLTLIHNKLANNAEKESKSSVLYRILSTFYEDGYQMTSSDQQESKPDKDVEIHTITGKLVGAGVEHKLPTLAILAHYDTTGLATSLPSHAGASGVAAVLELARLFSRFYADPKQRPKYNLLFVLSGGGKFNYFGTKHLIFEQMDNQDDDGLLPQAEYTMCLDEIASGDSLFVHVSKPPKEGTKPHKLLKTLNETWAYMYPDSPFPLAHKKVKLGDELLAWEHEQFSLKRLPAATLSSLESHSDLSRRSMFVTRSENNVDILSRNVKVIAEGVARHLFEVSCENSSDCGEVFEGSENGVHTDFLKAWMEFLASNARSPQLMTQEHPVVTGLEQALGRYAHDVTTYSHKPDGSEIICLFKS